MTIETYDNLRRLHPGKHIVIAEFGWPSAGPNDIHANPGRLEQATVLRDFVSRAEAYGIDYNVIESIDRPWKTMEGGVGPYWGLLDASHHAKFSWTGPILDPDFVKSAGLAVLLGLLLSLPILAMSGVTLAQAFTLAAASHLAGAWFAAIVAFWNGHYFVWGAAVALTLGVVLLIPLVAIALARVDEIAAIAFGRPPRRLAISPPLAPEGYAPKVSIHVPACCEPPEMLCATLDAVAKLDYPNLRMRGDHQQHARSQILGAGRGALQDARRAIQIPAARKAFRLQSRRAPHRARTHRARRRGHRRDRRGLCRARRIG